MKCLYKSPRPSFTTALAQEKHNRSSKGRSSFTHHGLCISPATFTQVSDTTILARVTGLLSPHSSLIPRVRTKVVEGFTHFMTVKLQPMLTGNRHHNTRNCTVQPGVLMPPDKKTKSQCSCCSESLKNASTELAHPSARAELQVETNHNFTTSKEERNTWGKGYSSQSEKTGYEHNFRNGEDAQGTEGASLVTASTHRNCRQLQEQHNLVTFKSCGYNLMYTS